MSCRETGRRIKAERQIIGIGSGSTVPYVVDRIVAQGLEANKGRVFIPTGKHHETRGAESRFPIEGVDH